MIVSPKPTPFLAQRPSSRRPTSARPVSSQMEAVGRGINDLGTPTPRDASNAPANCCPTQTQTSCSKLVPMARAGRATQPGSSARRIGGRTDGRVPPRSRRRPLLSSVESRPTAVGSAWTLPFQPDVRPAESALWKGLPQNHPRPHNPPVVKTCSDCERTHDAAQLLCPCGEVLETSHYLRWIWITSVLALATVAALVAFGAMRSFSILEVVVMEAAYLVVLYPGAKLMQSRKDRDRPVSAEMGSVFSGRYDRCLVLGAIAGIVYAWSFSAGASALGVVDPAYAPVRTVWLWVAMILWVTAIAAIVRDQGLALFDLRIANTYAHRNSQRVPSESVRKSE